MGCALGLCGADTVAMNSIGYSRTPSARRRQVLSFGAFARSELSAGRWGIFFLVVIAGTWSIGLAAGFTFALSALTLFGLVAAIYGLINPVAGLFGVGILCTDRQSVGAHK